VAKSGLEGGTKAGFVAMNQALKARAESTQTYVSKAVSMSNKKSRTGPNSGEGRAAIAAVTGRRTQPPVAGTPGPTLFGKLTAKLKHVKGAIVAVAGLGALLSGLLGYWSIYQAVKVAAPSLIGSAPAHISPLSIIVLPFANQTGDMQKAYIADALTTGITSDLSRIRDAFVIPPATAFTYKAKTASVQQIGKDVGVRFVLQGSVLASGEKIRISAQLADAQSGAQLWTDTFDGDLSDLFALQDKVTTRIGNSIGREMVILAARESETRKSSPVVADLMLRGRALELKPQSLKNWQEIETLYRQALALAPKNAGAMVGLARSLVLQASNFGSSADQGVLQKKYAEGYDLALQAKELDPDDPGIYSVIQTYAFSQQDYAGARRAAQTRLALEPKNPMAYNNLALSFLSGGEPKKAIELLTQAFNLDPVHPNDFILLDMGEAHFMLGENDAAIDWCQRSLERNPAYPTKHACLALAYAAKGDDAKAHAAAAEVRRLDPSFGISSVWRLRSTDNAASKAWYEGKLVPAWRKAGLPE
jgi:adenylate cyclase